MHNFFPHMDMKSHVSGFCVHIFDIWISIAHGKSVVKHYNVASCESLGYLYVALI